MQLTPHVVAFYYVAASLNAGGRLKNAHAGSIGSGELNSYTARRAVLRNRTGFTRLTYSVLFRTTSTVAMSGKRFLHRAGWWMMLVGVLLYGFADIAFLGEAVFGAGALLVLANAETYSQRKAEVLTLLSKIGLCKSPDGKSAA